MRSTTIESIAIIIENTSIVKENAVIEIEILDIVDIPTNITTYAATIKTAVFASVDFHNFAISCRNIYLYNILDILSVEI